MTEMELIEILNDLDDEEFQNFKWFLKKETWRDTAPLKVNQLSKAERRNTVDLMVQKYEMCGALGVTMSVLKKINRNDLVKEVQILMETTEDPGPADPPGALAESQSDSANNKLWSIRSQFVDRASEPVLHKLLDKLLEHRVLTDDEMERAVSANRAEKARMVIDMVRRKGPRACSALITALCEVDPCLSEELQLM